jgi:hypothetical protein
LRVDRENDEKLEASPDRHGIDADDFFGVLLMILHQSIARKLADGTILVCCARAQDGILQSGSRNEQYSSQIDAALTSFMQIVAVLVDK